MAGDSTLKDIEQLGAWARHHPMVRAAGVYVGASWVLVQALGLFGAPLDLLRLIALVLLFGLGAGLLVMWRLAARRAAPITAQRRIALRSGRTWAATLILLLVGSAAWLARPRKEVTAGADLIAVLPFAVSGAAAQDLGEGMVDLLSTSLDQVGPIRTLSARTVLREWRTRVKPGAGATPEEALSIARNLGAASVLTGSAVAVGQALKLTATLQSLAGTQLAEASTTGPIDSVFMMVDALTVQLLEDVWRGRDPVPNVRVSAISTTSLPAIRSFLRGARMFRESKFDSAKAAYLEAVAADSTFALAWQQLSLTIGFAGASHGAPQMLEYAEAANRYADRLPERDRRLLRAQLLHAEGDLAAFDSLRVYTASYPDDVAGWYLLSDAHFHAQYLLALGPAEILPPFERALALDSTLAPAVLHPLDIGLWNHDQEIVDRYFPRALALLPDNLLTSYGRTRTIAFAPADSAASQFSQSFSQPTYPIWTLAKRVTSTPAEDGRLLLKAAALHAGVPRTGNRVAEMRIAAGHVTEGLTTDDPLATGATRSLAARAAVGGLLSDEMIRDWRARVPHDTITMPILLQRLQLAMAASDYPNARAILDAPVPDSVANSFIGPGVLEALHGWLDYSTGKVDAGIDQMDRGLRRAGYSTSRTLGALAGLRFVHAVALSRKADRRAEGLKRLQEFSSNNPYLAAPAQFARAQALEASGDSSGAVTAYLTVVRLFIDADPHLQSLVAAAHASVKRLQADPPSR